MVALGWTEEAIGVALAQPLRQIRKLRLLSNILPAMLDSMAKATYAERAAVAHDRGGLLDEQKEIWKAHKPKKGDPQVSWWSIANGFTKPAHVCARDASFGDDLAQAYGIEWVEDLFAPPTTVATTNVEAFLGAQHEWMTSHPPKRGIVTEITTTVSRCFLQRRSECMGKARQKGDDGHVSRS